MASVEQKFRAMQREYPHHSTLINFGRAIKDEQLSERRAFYFFGKLVEKGDYAKEDFKQVRKIYCAQTPTQKQGFSRTFGAVLTLKTS